MESNQTYYLFAWEIHGAAGGLNDLIGIYSTLADADTAFIDYIHKSYFIDRGEIFHLETQKIVKAWSLDHPERMQETDWELESRLPLSNDFYRRRWFKINSDYSPEPKMSYIKKA